MATPGRGSAVLAKARPQALSPPSPSFSSISGCSSAGDPSQREAFLSAQLEQANLASARQAERCAALRCDLDAVRLLAGALARRSQLPERVQRELDDLLAVAGNASGSRLPPAIENDGDEDEEDDAEATCSADGRRRLAGGARGSSSSSSHWKRRSSCASTAAAEDDEEYTAGLDAELEDEESLRLEADADAAAGGPLVKIDSSWDFPLSRQEKQLRLVQLFDLQCVDAMAENRQLRIETRRAQRASDAASRAAAAMALAPYGSGSDSGEHSFSSEDPAGHFAEQVGRLLALLEEAPAEECSGRSRSQSEGCVIPAPLAIQDEDSLWNRGASVVRELFTWSTTDE
eukprot:TRINITY_DN16975_c0_g1_i1.p2 TRINITY_DN16975_c0_g1~~TRINITY_DN16975_c0_g1_i1.p2  ORF type:complete len:369 (-),score=95.32 TRINITY_DN16975_c0_g1_i1:80-1114(-)